MTLSEQKANLKNVKVSDIELGLAKGNRLFDRGQLLDIATQD
jgi:hypothetical protein